MYSNNSKLTNSIQQDYLRDAENYRLMQINRDNNNPFGSILKTAAAMIIATAVFFTLIQVFII